MTYNQRVFEQISRQECVCMKEFLFTSESVTGGHPDKVADQISDAVLDEILRQDPRGRVACETMVTTGLVIVAGEITTSALLDIPDLVRKTVTDIGYTGDARGFDAHNCAVVTAIDRQSVDIARGVDRGASEKQGAGDQGMMFGYACDETKERMPMPISFAHKICARLTEAREKKVLRWLRPDGKSQVTVRYVDGVPREVSAVVCSAQHAEDVSRKTLTEGIMEEVIRKAIPKELLAKNAKFYINPTGRFVVGGPHGDTGLTGRKIIVDTYGGYSRHGGGAFSGKDPSKVDRSAAYMARHVAKNVVAAGLARKCEVELAYAIGVAEPVSVMVETFGTALVPEERISRAIREVFDLRPAMITKSLDLLRPIYRKTAALGHFGRELPEFTWERTDKVGALRKSAG
ncbi:MAG: S-adenosylmethionine synthase [Actinobacteria bacterium]|nr:S-adenosylmethionine synthase [Actinomycetota bacterium]